jgi:hypothetical protein
VSLQYGCLLFGTVRFQVGPVRIDGVESEFFRQAATLGKGQDMADRTTVGAVRVGRRIRHIQGAKPSVSGRVTGYRRSVRTFRSHFVMCHLPSH